MDKNGADTPEATGSQECPFASLTYANARLLALPVPPAANGSFTVYYGTGLFSEPGFHLLPYVWYEANSLDDTFLQTAPCLSLAPQWNGLDGAFGGIKGTTSLSRLCLDFGATNSPSSQFYFEEWAISSQVQISLNYTSPLISLSGNQSAGAKPPFPPPAPAPNVYASTSPNQIFFINCFINDANSKIQLPGPIPPIPLPAALYPALEASGVGVFFLSTSISSGWIVLNPSPNGPTTFAAQEGSTGPSAGVSGSQNGGLLATGGTYRTLVSLQGYPFSFSLSIPLVDLNIAAIQLVGEAYAQYDTVSWSGDPKDLNLTPDNNCLCQSRDVSCYPPTGPCWNVTDEAPALGYDPTHPDYWLMNPGNPMTGETWPNSVQDLENFVGAMCFLGDNCTSNSSTGYLQNYFRWKSGPGFNLTTWNVTAGLNEVDVDLPILFNGTQHCSSYSNNSFTHYGLLLMCGNQTANNPPNGTLQAGQYIGFDTSNPNVTVVNNLGLFFLSDGTSNVTDSGIIIRGTPNRATAVLNSGTGEMDINVLLEPGTCMAERVQSGETFLDNSGVCTIDELSGTVTTSATAPITKTVAGQNIAYGWDESTTINNPIDSPTCTCTTATSDITNTEKIQNPTGPCTVPVVFPVPPVVQPCPPSAPPPPSPANNPEGGTQGPGRCIGSCGRGSSGSSSSTSSSSTSPPSSSTSTTSYSSSSGFSSGYATTSSATTGLTTAAAGTTAGGSSTSGSLTTGSVGPDPLGWGWRTGPPPDTWQIPAVNSTISSPCTPGQEYLDLATNQFFDCDANSVWEARLYSCPLESMCGNSSIVNGVPLQTVVNVTDLGNGTKEFSIGLYYNWTEASFCPACGYFGDNSGRQYFNQSWVYNPVLNLILEETNGSQVVMHNNVTVTCEYPVLCSSTQSVDPATNLTNSNLAVSVAGFLANITGIGITNIICEGTNLLCPQNNTEVTFRLVGLANISTLSVLPFPCEYYVDRAGSDTVGTGSSLNPWFSIAHAVAQVDASGCGSGAVVYFGTGTWSEDWTGTTSVPFSFVGTEGTVFGGLFNPGGSANPSFYSITFTENQGWTTTGGNTFFVGCTGTGLSLTGSGTPSTVTLTDTRIDYVSTIDVQFILRNFYGGASGFGSTSTSIGTLQHQFYDSQILGMLTIHNGVGGTSTNSLLLRQTTVYGVLDLSGAHISVSATPGAYDPTTLVLANGAVAPTVIKGAGIVPYFSVDGGTAHDGLKLNLKSGTGVQVTDQGSGNVLFSTPATSVSVSLAGPETLTATNAALNLTVNGTSYYIPAGNGGLQQGIATFTTSFQWGLLNSGPVDISLSAIGGRVSVYIAPFGFNAASSAGSQALIVATDPLPPAFYSQLAGGAQVGQAVAFYDLINFVVLPAYPYVNFYQHLVFSSQANSFGGDTSGLSALTTFGGVSYSYIMAASGLSINCTGVHWNVSSSIVNLGDVHFGGSPGYVEATVAVVNDGGGDIGMFQFAFRGGSAAGWTATATPGTCPPGLTLPPGQSCAVQVRFTPTGASGLHGATLTLNYRCLGSPVGGISAVEMGFVANAIGVPVTTPPPTSPPPSTAPPPTYGPGGPAFYYSTNYGPCCGGNIAIVFQPTEIPSDERTHQLQIFWFTVGYSLTGNFTQVVTSIYGSDAAFFTQQNPDTCVGCPPNKQQHCDFLVGQTLVPRPTNANETNKCWTAMWFAAPDYLTYSAYLQVAGVYQGAFTQLTWTLTGKGSFIAPSGGEKPSWGAWAVSIVTSGFAGDDKLSRGTTSTTTGGYLPKPPEELRGKSGADEDRENDGGGRGSRKELKAQ